MKSSIPNSYGCTLGEKKMRQRGADWPAANAISE